MAYCASEGGESEAPGANQEREAAGSGGKGPANRQLGETWGQRAGKSIFRTALPATSSFFPSKPPVKSTPSIVQENCEIVSLKDLLKFLGDAK